MSDQDKIAALESKLNNALNLTAALQVVASDFAQAAFENDEERIRRDAVIGLAEAFEQALV